MSQSIHCSGANTASGGEYEEIHCSGSLKIQGDTACQALQNSGALKLAGSLVCTEELHSSGALRVEGAIRTGRARVSGLLNAEKIEIEVSGSNEVGDIGGGTITVRRISHGLSFGERVLRVKSIEGDTVDLECTQAEVVRGKNIRIGRNCRIGRVEYSGDLTVEGGEVGEQVRI